MCRFILRHIPGPLVAVIVMQNSGDTRIVLPLENKKRLSDIFEFRFFLKSFGKASFVNDSIISLRRRARQLMQHLSESFISCMWYGNCSSRSLTAWKRTLAY